MEEKDNLEKAMTLMSSALKQYEDGKFDLAEHSRREANKLFDEMAQEMSTQDGMDKIRFGESRNFGMLYQILENNSKELYANGKEKLAKVISTIKNNPVLLSEFKTYNAFTNPTNVDNPETYVNEAVTLAVRHSTKELKKANMELLSEYRKLNLNENVETTPEEIELFEDIEYVITNKPKLGNINEYTNVKKRLSECVRERNTVSVGQENLRHTVDEAYDSLSRKYNNELTSDEIELVESFSAGDDKAERKFNQVKEGLARKINKELMTSEGTERKKWETLMESIQSRVYNKKTALVDVAEMLEAVSVIEE